MSSLEFVGAGTANIIATQAADANYNAATVTAVLTVAKAARTLTAFADISAFAIALAATCLATIESVAISAPVTLFAAILDVIICAVAM